MQLVQEAYLANRRTYGYRRIQIWLEQQKVLTINHKEVLRLMNKLGIHSVARKRNPYRPTKEQHHLHHYPHLLQRHIQAERPNQKRCTDISYVHISTRNDVALVAATLKQARKKNG